MREIERMDAFIWAGLHAGPGAIPFFAVPVGGQFRFASSEEVYTKTSKQGWYVSQAGRKFRTGAKAAVFEKK